MTKQIFYIRSPLDTDLEPKELTWKFGEISTEDLIDLTASVSQYIKLLEKWNKSAREVLQTRVKTPKEVGDLVVVKGHNVAAVFNCIERTDIDRKRLRAEMGDEWYNKYCTTIKYTSMRFQAIEAIEE